MLRGITPRGSLARMVAARGSSPTTAPTPTPATSPAATHSQTAPMHQLPLPTTPAQGRPASPGLLPAVSSSGSGSGLFTADPVYALSGASLTKKAHHDTVHKAAAPVQEATVRNLPVAAAPLPKTTVAAGPVPMAALQKLPVPATPVQVRPAEGACPPTSCRGGSVVAQ